MDSEALASAVEKQAYQVKIPIKNLGYSFKSGSLQGVNKQALPSVWLISAPDLSTTTRCLR